MLENYNDLISLIVVIIFTLLPLCYAGYYVFKWLGRVRKMRIIKLKREAFKHQI